MSKGAPTAPLPFHTRTGITQPLPHAPLHRVPASSRPSRDHRREELLERIRDAGLSQDEAAAALAEETQDPLIRAFEVAVAGFEPAMSGRVRLQLSGLLSQPANRKGPISRAFSK